LVAVPNAGPHFVHFSRSFDVEAGRDAHLTGEIAKALMANASTLFSNELQIEKMEILANK